MAGSRLAILSHLSRSRPFPPSPCSTSFGLCLRNLIVFRNARACSKYLLASPSTCSLTYMYHSTHAHIILTQHIIILTQHITILTQHIIILTQHIIILTLVHHHPNTAHHHLTQHIIILTQHIIMLTLVHHHPNTAHHHPNTAHHHPNTAHHHPNTAHHHPNTAHHHPNTAHHTMCSHCLIRSGNCPMLHQLTCPLQKVLQHDSSVPGGEE